MADTEKKTCPLLGWEILKMQENASEQMTAAAVGAVALELIKTLLVGFMANALMDIIEDGVDMYDSVMDKVTDLINSISPVSWMMYGLSNHAKEINGAAVREKDMLLSVVALIESLKATEKNKNSKYVRISKRALKTAKNIKINLDKASSMRTATKMYSYIKIAESLANANQDLLSARTSGSRNTTRSAASIVNSASSAFSKDGVAIKPADMAASAVNTMLEGIASKSRKELAELMDSLLKKYSVLCRILYLYTGINYIPLVTSMRKRTRRIIGMISLNDASNYAIIDDELTALSAEFKKTAKKIWKEAKNGLGLYTKSISSSYDVKDTSDSLITPNEGTALEALMTVSAYSPAPNDRLTIFGASTKLATSIGLYNMLISAVNVESYSDKVEKKVSGDIAKIAMKIQDVSTAIDDADDGVYSFDDCLGMIDARYQAIITRSQIAGLDRSLRGDVNAEANAEFMAKLKELDLNISEPLMGVAIVVKVILPTALAPFYTNKTANKSMVKVAKDRIAYLNGVISGTADIMNYRNPACESVIAEINACGMGSLADAAKYGQIASGAVSVLAGIAGGSAAVIELYNSCVKDNPNGKKAYRDVQDGVAKLKKAAASVIRDAIDIVLSPLGYGVAIIDFLNRMNEKMEKTKENVQEMQSNIAKMKKEAAEKEAEIREKAEKAKQIAEDARAAAAFNSV